MQDCELLNSYGEDSWPWKFEILLPKKNPIWGFAENPIFWYFPLENLAFYALDKSVYFFHYFLRRQKGFFLNVNFYLLYWISNSFIAFEVLKTAPCALKRFIFVDLRIWNFIILIYFTLLKVSIYLLLFSLNIECLRICW